MKVLVLGGDGMLGHQVVRVLAGSNDVVTTLRNPPTSKVTTTLVGCRIISGLDVRVPDAAMSLLLDERPDVVVNSVGIVKQRAAAADPLESIAVNSLFPHHLALACRLAGARLIHLSTDCVFSGDKGDYSETDNPDPVDLYGRTKLLGEVSGPGCLTIRTSMIGLELAHHSSLVEWFLSQQGSVPGYTRARWSGLTTVELARVIEKIIRDHPQLHGVWHVSGPVISKCELLTNLAAMLGGQTTVMPDHNVVVDRSLNSQRFRAAVIYEPPSWQLMLSELSSAVREREANIAVRR